MFSPPHADAQSGFFNTADGDYSELEDLSWLDNIINDVGGSMEETGTLAHLPLELSSQSSTSPSTGQNSATSLIQSPSRAGYMKLAGEKVSKRPKGRPKRIHEGPETATQRRKEQIRKAQQAYRNRKEETITLLKEENNLLKSRLEIAEQSLDRLLEVAARKGVQSDGFQTSGRLEYTLYSSETNESSALVSGSGIVVSRKDISSPKEDILTNLAAHKQDPALHLLEYTPPDSFPLSIRLRHEGLKKGYRIITSQDTPNSLLAKCFKHYLFSNTRYEITKQINALLYQSSKIMNQNLTPPDSPTKDPDTPEARMDRGFGLSNLYSADTEGYIVPEGVEKYLIDKGMKVDPGSNLFTLSTSTVVSRQGPRTLFDEIRGSQELHLSVSKLLEELLNRVVCLEVGPGIRAQEIDEAIQATIMASI